MKEKIKELQNIDPIYKSIRQILEKARNSAYRAINFAMVQAYWHIGKVIVEEEQKGKRGQNTEKP